MAQSKTGARRWPTALDTFVAKWNREFDTLKAEVAKHQRFAENLITACRTTTAMLEQSQKQMEQDRLELMEAAIKEEEEARKAAHAHKEDGE